MTHRERELLTFIERYMAEHGGVAPTLDEMGAGVGIKSKSGVHAIVGSLVRQGLLRRTDERHRGLAVVAQAVDLASVPDGTLLQEVAARGLIRAGAA